MANTAPRTPKADSPADGVTANGPDVSDVSPLDPRGFQPNQAVNGTISTNPPRGVDELPANAVADEPSAAAVQNAIQKQIDGEEERGWRGGRRTKPTPNSAYTLAGVNAGIPTPETVVHTPKSA
jgi:hypothetical protein